MNTRQVRLFLKVVEQRSFSAAAREAFVTPQSVAQQIGRLEREVGFRLLDRTAQGVCPTAAGTLFYEGCMRMDRDLSALLARCHELARPGRDVIRLGASESYGLNLFARFVPAFLREHPSMDVDYAQVGADPVADLLAGAYDVVEGVAQQAREGVTFQRLARVERCCVLSTRNPLSHRERIAPRDLIGQRVYVFSLDWARSVQDMLDGVCPEVQLREIPERELRASIRLAEDGDVVYLLPTTVAPQYVPLISVPFAADASCAYGLLFAEAQRGRLHDFLLSARRSFASQDGGGRPAARA